MKRITAVFPTRAEAEAAYAALRGINLAQGAISLLADASRRVNADADDSTSSRAATSESGFLPVTPLLAPMAMGGVGGFGSGSSGVVAVGPALLALGSDPASGTESSTRANDLPAETAGGLHPLATSGDSGSSSPILSATLEGFSQAGYAPTEAEYYSSAVSQGHAVLSVELGADEQEAEVRQIIGQNEGYPFMGALQ